MPCQGPGVAGMTAGGTWTKKKALGQVGPSERLIWRRWNAPVCPLVCLRDWSRLKLGESGGNRVNWNWQGGVDRLSVGRSRSQTEVTDRLRRCA